MKTVGTKLIVKEIAPAEQKTAGGLFIPGTAKREQLQGIVQSVGPKVVSATVGETVTFHPGSGTAVEIEGAPYLVLQEMELLVIE